MGSKTTTTQRSDPWEPAQPALEGIIGSAGDLYGQGGFEITPYGGPMVAGPTDATTMGQQGILDAIPGNVQANQQAQAALMGMLDPNARSGAWNQVRANTMAEIMPAINGSFAGSGMTGSSLHAQNLAKGTAAGMAGVEQQAFDQGNARAMQAASMLPQLQAASPYNAALQVGQQQQGQNQAEIDAMIQNYYMGQDSSAAGLERYAAMMSGLGGQFGSQTGTQQTNPGLMGILGLGLQAFGGPLGALGGAAMGGGSLTGGGAGSGIGMRGIF